MALSFSPPLARESTSGGLRELTDDQLLARFFRRHEDAAFAAIVARHGALVYGVCQRILSNASDADDAFQATFLVLVRKGSTLREPGRLASWLYGVAHRTARKMKAQAATRLRREQEPREAPSPSSVGDMTYKELCAVLDEEINKLPEKYSLPLVLCYLEGKTNSQAAAQLGWPEGSISRRLSRARELLRSRLARRGLAITAALIAAVFARPLAAAPLELTASTLAACNLVAQGVAIEEVASPVVANLAKEALLSASLAQRFSSALFAVGLLVFAGGLLAWQLSSPVYGASAWFGDNWQDASPACSDGAVPIAGACQAAPCVASAAKGN